MSDHLAETEVEYSWGRSGSGALSLNWSTTSSAFIAFLETLVPLRVAMEEGLQYVQQQNLPLSELLLQSKSLEEVESRIPLSIYIAYAYNDLRFLPKIEEKLQAIKYQIQNIDWQFGEIAQDTRWKIARHDFLHTANLILLLITPAFVATEFCYCEQLKWAIIRHEQELSFVIPVLLQACLWDETPFARLRSRQRIRVSG